MLTMLSSDKPAAGDQIICSLSNIDGFDIVLMQHPTRKNNSFSVQYGKQLDHDLTYAQAAAKYGQAVMHALSCTGNVDNERN